MDPDAALPPAALEPELELDPELEPDPELLYAALGVDLYSTQQPAHATAAVTMECRSAMHRAATQHMVVVHSMECITLHYEHQ